MQQIEDLGLIKRDITQPSKEKWYTYKNGNIFPYYREDVKKVVNVFKPKTFLPLFKELNIPFIPNEWFHTVVYQIEHSKDLSNVFGKYLAKMKLNAWKNFNFEDSERFCTYDIEDYCKQEYIPEIKLTAIWENLDNV